MLEILLFPINYCIQLLIITESFPIIMEPAMKHNSRLRELHKMTNHLIIEILFKFTVQKGRNSVVLFRKVALYLTICKLLCFMNLESSVLGHLSFTSLAEIKISQRCAIRKHLWVHSMITKICPLFLSSLATTYITY